MTASEIQHIQHTIGVVPDGFWGPKSTAACQAHLLKLMPKQNPWPLPEQKSLTDFYGHPGDTDNLVAIHVEHLDIEYDNESVKTIRVHEKCAESLFRVLSAIAKTPSRHVLLDYAGVFNDRPMRGGNLPSLHARGAAIDLRPTQNQNRSHWPTAADMPLEVMECFAREGWVAAGAFWSRDAMHFQATR